MVEVTETKNEPTLFVNERHPSAIMTGSRQFPLQVALMLNGNGVLSSEQVDAFTALFVASPKTERQRVALLEMVKLLSDADDPDKLDSEALCDACIKARALIAECESGDAKEAAP